MVIWLTSRKQEVSWVFYGLLGTLYSATDLGSEVVGGHPGDLRDPLNVGGSAGVNGRNLVDVSSGRDSPGHDSDLHPLSVVRHDQRAARVSSAGRDISTGGADVGVPQGISESRVHSAQASLAHSHGEQVLLGRLEGKGDAGENAAAVDGSPTEEAGNSGIDDSRTALADGLDELVQFQGLVDADQDHIVGSDATGSPSGVDEGVGVAVESTDLLVGHVVGAVGHSALELKTTSAGHLRDAVGGRQEPSSGQDGASAGVLHVGDSPTHAADEGSSVELGILSVDNAGREPLRGLGPEGF